MKAMPRVQCLVLTIAGMLACEARAQSPANARLEFDVASVKANHGLGGGTFGVGNGGGGGRNIPLKTLIAFAYRIQEFQVTGGPGWVGSDRYDVQGKSADPKADPDQLRLMLRSLMADRFKLKFHRETKQASVYALVVAKGGPKIKLVADQESPDVNGPSQPGAGPNRGAFRMGAGSLVGNAVSLSLFIRFLSQQLDRTILDKTGLSGRFNIQLQWTPGPGEWPYDPGGTRFPPPADTSGPSVFVAIQEQLGLKLDSAKGPVEFFVIDQVERPSEN